MISYERVSSDEELEQILVLQRKNLPAIISSEEKVKEGFVTVSHTFEILKKMNTACAHIIAKSDDKVVGYALCMHPKFANEIHVLQPMFDEIDSIEPTIENYIAMGQVCIDKAFRKKGIFRKLYETMQVSIRPEFDTIITEVDAKNSRSLQAHYGIGFTDLKTYSVGGQDWKVIKLLLKVPSCNLVTL